MRVGEATEARQASAAGASKTPQPEAAGQTSAVLLAEPRSSRATHLHHGGSQRDLDRCHDDGGPRLLLGPRAELQRGCGASPDTSRVLRRLTPLEFGGGSTPPLAAVGKAGGSEDCTGRGGRRRGALHAQPFGLGCRAPVPVRYQYRYRVPGAQVLVRYGYRCRYRVDAALKVLNRPMRYGMEKQLAAGLAATGAPLKGLPKSDLKSSLGRTVPSDDSYIYICERCSVL